MTCGCGDPLESLELASGFVFGLCSDMKVLPGDRQSRTVRSALEDAVLPALRRTPCVVSFSGGRDSSAVLAVATDVARRRGLPLPVPVTLRFPGHATTAEDEWQTLVVRHLGVVDWERVELTDEIDVIGPYARRVLRRHGVLWPTNTHFHLPIFERASGGSVLTGIGGDEVLSPSSWGRTTMLRAGRAIPRVADLPSVGLACAPRAIRSRLLRKRIGVDADLPWLRHRVRREVVRRLAADAARRSVRYDVALRDMWWRSRYRHRACMSLQQIADDLDVRVDHPLQDASVLRALAAHAGAGGYWSRTAACEDLFGDLLPPSLLERRTKATFDDAFWNTNARAFVRAWDGQSIDTDMVNVDVLRRLWTRGDMPPPLSLLLVQHVWLREARACSAPRT